MLSGSYFWPSFLRGEKQFLSVSEVLFTINWILHSKDFINWFMKRASGGPWLSSVPLVWVYLLLLLLLMHWMRTLLLTISLQDIYFLLLTRSQRMLEQNFAECLGCKSNTASNASCRLLRVFKGSNKYNCLSLKP